MERIWNKFTRTIRYGYLRVVRIKAPAESIAPWLGGRRLCRGDALFVPADGHRHCARFFSHPRKSHRRGPMHEADQPFQLGHRLSSPLYVGQGFRAWGGREPEYERPDQSGPP